MKPTRHSAERRITLAPASWATAVLALAALLAAPAVQAQIRRPPSFRPSTNDRIRVISFRKANPRAVKRYAQARSPDAP
jgi:uncharacterized DUF497 family protein